MAKIKIHEASRLVVAVCDSDLFGKVLEEGNGFLDLSTTFFDGEEKEGEELVELLKEYKMEDATFNIVGKESCDAAKEAGVITEDIIRESCGVPIALVLL